MDLGYITVSVHTDTTDAYTVSWLYIVGLILMIALLQRTLSMIMMISHIVYDIANNQYNYVV